MRLRCRLGWHKYEYSTMLPIRHVRVAWMACECGARSGHGVTYIGEEIDPTPFMHPKENR